MCSKYSGISAQYYFIFFHVRYTKIVSKFFFIYIQGSIIYPFIFNHNFNSIVNFDNCTTYTLDKCKTTSTIRTIWVLLECNIVLYSSITPLFIKFRYSPWTHISERTSNSFKLYFSYIHFSGHLVNSSTIIFWFMCLK